MESGEEQKHFEKVVRSIRFYEVHSKRLIRQKQLYYERLPPQDRELLKALGDRFPKFLKAVEANSELFRRILQPTKLFINSTLSSSDGKEEEDTQAFNQVSENDMDRVRTILRQLVREWTSAGEGERRQSFGPIVRAVKAAFENVPDASAIKILVPGAGLGRLAWELARLGHSVQGNDFSYYHLLTANYVLNCCYRENREGSTEDRGIKIFPFVHQTNNVVHEKDLLLEVEVPDVNPRTLPKSNADFSMTGGEFIEVYGMQDEEWDCVCTCFFIDTAHNAVEYIRTIEKILKPNGLWINLGPLLYHYADMFSETSVEPTLQELLSVTREVGFDVAEPQFIRCAYTASEKSMLKTEYDCAFFVAMKSVVNRKKTSLQAESNPD